MVELLEAAEAKAYYGLAINWAPLNALVDALLDKGVLQGREVAHILDTAGVIHFPDPYIVGFGWDTAGATVGWCWPCVWCSDGTYNEISQTRQGAEQCMLYTCHAWF